MEKLPLTRAGQQILDAELKRLKSTERPAVIRAIAEAREHGDLSENAEYHAAREKQSFIEGRIKELESVLSRADVIDPAKLSGSVKFGASVKLVDEDTDEEKTYQIVGEAEADLEKGLLNLKSPLARGADWQGRRGYRHRAHAGRRTQLRDTRNPVYLAHVTDTAFRRRASIRPRCTPGGPRAVRGLWIAACCGPWHWRSGCWRRLCSSCWQIS